MITFLYQIFLHIYALFYLLQRRCLTRFKLPVIDCKKEDVIWVHAVSMGETEACAPLLKKLKEQYQNCTIICSTITETGLATAKKTIPFADHHLILPLDLFWIMRPLIQRTLPKLVIVTETDLWFNFLKECKRIGAKLMIINGKISKKSMRFYQKVPTYRDAIFSLFDSILVQNDEYRSRFLSLGVEAEILETAGNIKLDRSVIRMDKKEEDAFRNSLGLSPTDPVIVFGSTHTSEEALALEIHKKLSVKFQNLKCLIVPRHPARFDTVAKLIKKKGYKFSRYSRPDPKENIILVDAIGQLMNCYQVASAAVVCGSFTPKVGGHNIIEPLYFNTPLLYGPYMQTQSSLDSLVKKYQAGIQVRENDLENALESILNSRPSMMTKLGEKLISEQQGALNRTFSKITLVGNLSDLLLSNFDQTK